MESKRTILTRQYQALDQERLDWWTKRWQPVRDWILPLDGQYQDNERQLLNLTTSKVVDPTATLAAFTYGRGMTAGLVNATIPWFKLGFLDPELSRWKPAQVWAEQATDHLRQILLKSNFYQAAPNVFRGLPVFGTAAMGVYEDAEDVVRFYTYPIGSWMIAHNARLKVDTWMRKLQYTARQIVERFGMDRVSHSVKTAYESGRHYEPFTICHAVAPNNAYDPKRLHKRFKRWTSFYWEESSDETQWLGESGFDRFPIVAPRYDLDGEDVYGIAPAFYIVNHVRMLQTQHRYKGRAVQKMVDPPLVAAAELRQLRVSTEPGEITYANIRQGIPSLSPVYAVNFPLGELREDIRETQGIIRRAMHEDLFLMFASSDRRQITAEEIRARYEEKQANLSPVIERTEDEFNDPVIDNVYAIAERAGRLPPPPPELLGQPLKVEYTSVLAQIAKTQELAKTERLVGFVGANAGVLPDMVAKLIPDQLVQHYADSLGASPRLLRSEEEMEQARADAAERQAAVERAALAEQGAKTAKILSETATTGDNALAEARQ